MLTLTSVLILIFVFLTSIWAERKGCVYKDRFFSPYTLTVEAAILSLMEETSLFLPLCNALLLMSRQGDIFAALTAGLHWKTPNTSPLSVDLHFK